MSRPLHASGKARTEDSRRRSQDDGKRTIELRPEMIEVREDFKGCNGRPNTDGSGLISADLMTEIAECVGCPGRRISLVKFSKGSATGMHVCSNNIARRPSVILFAEKMKFGDLPYFKDYEPCQCEIEVCGKVIVCADESHRHPAQLNQHLISVLQNLGCRPHVFLELGSRMRSWGSPRYARVGRYR